MLNELVNGSSSLQYKIELAISGLADNLEHPLSRSAKRPVLHAYRNAWSRVEDLSARKSNTTVAPIEDGPAWELTLFGRDITSVPRRYFDTVTNTVGTTPPQ